MFAMLVDSIVNSITDHLSRGLIPKRSLSVVAILGTGNLIASDIKIAIEDIKKWRLQYFPWAPLHPEKCVATHDAHQVDYLDHLLRGGSLIRAYESASPNYA